VQLDTPGAARKGAYLLVLNNAPTNTATAVKKPTESTENQSWVGFVCRDCGAPLALHRSNNGSRPGERSLRGWRITCPSCGVPDFYELGTPMVKITAT
jgi:hypothetical protein